MPRFPLLFAVLCCPLIVGCDGCQTGSQANPDAESELSAEDFAAGRPVPYPADEKVTTSGIKPGHWFTAMQSLKSNNSDSRGALNSLSGMVPTVPSGGPARQESWSDIQALRTGSILSRRPVVMPKGQNKKIDYRAYTPKRFFNGKAKCYLSNRFVSSERAESFSAGAYPFTRMGPAEYFFVVLTERPERFTRFQVSDWTRKVSAERGSEFDSGEAVINYRVVTPFPEDYYPLPLPLAETMLDWTNTAVVFWDDLPPEALTPQQQTALADWVHYGGQLIVNGAAAADSINKSSIADLLPLRPTGNIELDVNAAAELLTNWQVPDDASTDQQVALLKGRESRVAIDGVANAGSKAIEGSGNLILSRRAGSGRVVQARCDLMSDWLTSWKSYDSFVNSVLLLRPPRRVDRVDSVGSGGDLTTNVRSYVLPNGREEVFADATMNTRFRIAARDAALPVATPIVKRGATGLIGGRDAYTRIDSLSGIGGWSDSSDVIRLCREILRSEAGIEIPDSSLVLRSLGYYLCILIPINYLIFRMLGKLEYAWLAVPVIAVGGAIWVAREARLDIGFARSQTEVGLLEVQAGCDRAHLTRVTAIYNSLSSTYDIAFDTPGAAAAPIRKAGNSPPTSAVFKTGYAEGPILSGMIVGSNQVRMLHAEQMFSLGGSLSLDADGSLVNGTDRELFDAVVVRKDLLGKTEVANVGPCPGQSNTKLRFRPALEEDIVESLSEEMNSLERALVRVDAIVPGSTRLVARVGDSLPGMTITPSATQVSSTTTVLAHLEYSPWPSPLPDMNLPKSEVRVLKDSDLKIP